MSACPTTIDPVSEVYRCPRSGARLRATAEGFAAEDGSASYPVRDGCIVFLGRKHEENETDMRSIRRALERSRDVGWRAAVDEAYTPGTSGHRYITEAGRAGYVDLLAVDAESSVLEIGCSMGQHTEALAARCRMVCGIDVVPEQAAFARERCVQQGFTNVLTACGGDDGRLPYADGQFDAVVLNLVLEWCGNRSPEGHEVIQRRLLAEISRVMKPGGRLFLSTKNRFALEMLLGGRDEHTHMIRGGSALPRWMVRSLMRMRGLGETSGWLHSYSRLRAMVLDAGFGRVDSYWAAPEMRYPRWFIETEGSGVRRAMREHGAKALGAGRKQRLLLSLMPSSLVKHVTPGLTLLATK